MSAKQPGQLVENESKVVCVEKDQILHLAHRSNYLDETNRSWWNGLYSPINSAGETILQPLHVISVNLFSVWNLGDLMEDLKFQTK